MFFTDIYTSLYQVDLFNFNVQKFLSSAATFSGKPVYFWTSSKFVSEAISIKTNSPSMFLNTASSVISIDTTPFAVIGNEHSFSNFNSTSPVFLFLLKCCIVTITCDSEATKSIAPPIPRHIFPGIIQFAISQLALHSKAPSIVISKWWPLMILNEVDELKYDPPGNIVIGY